MANPMRKPVACRDTARRVGVRGGLHACYPFKINGAALILQVERPQRCGNVAGPRVSILIEHAHGHQRLLRDVTGDRLVRQMRFVEPIIAGERAAQFLKWLPADEWAVVAIFIENAIAATRPAA